MLHLLASIYYVVRTELMLMALHIGMCRGKNQSSLQPCENILYTEHRPVKTESLYFIMVLASCVFPFRFMPG